MPLIKVSIFQKNLNEGLNINVIKRLLHAKSDMMVLPEYFSADVNVKSLQQIQDRTKSTLDWLIKLNHTYKGIIVGGSVIKREEDGKMFNACPIIYNGDIIDWYYKRNLSNEEKNILTTGTEPGIFILNNIRFSVLIGEDVLQESFFKELKEQGIKLIFIVNKSFKEDSINYEEILMKHSKDNQQVFVKCDAVGSFLDKKLKGKSMLVHPNGISWHVTEQEQEMQIYKEIMVQV